MWRTLSESEKDSVATRIDAQDPFNKYGANAGEICESGLPFYPGARLLRVTNRTPAVGSRYFVERGDDLVPLHRLPDVPSFCDDRFGVVLDAGTATDYFRFAHFFSSEGEKTSPVEAPQDLQLDPRSYNPEHRRAVALIKPPDIESDQDGLIVIACTFDDKECRLYRDRYRLSPGRPLELLSREDSGINLGTAFHHRQLRLGRAGSPV